MRKGPLNLGFDVLLTSANPKWVVDSNVGLPARDSFAADRHLGSVSDGTDQARNRATGVGDGLDT
jgi:hypothetical protein